MKPDICVFFENVGEKFKIDGNLIRITVTLVHEEQYTLFIISRSILLRMRNC